jgi:4-diphosphocytidyl-2-C-methyl-D-erythritol kinase
VTVLQPLSLADEIELEAAEDLTVTGYRKDTLVRDSLRLLAQAAGTDAAWSVRIEKRIPVAAGLGGGSSDAAAALRLANETLSPPLPAARLHELAASVGADIPSFLTAGPKVGEGDGTALRAVELPQDYTVLVLLPDGATKPSTGAVYAQFDERGGARGFEGRRAELARALDGVGRAADLARLPPNDLVSSELARNLRELGAFRADVTGSGPALYGLFSDRSGAEAAERELAGMGRTWITRPAW